ncbi:MAG: hypothetical protein C4345_05310 [Chloroflexota bacterium]
MIGIAVAHPNGTVSKAGGFVVKNVSGFDLMRVYHGSLGTLAVIVSANFKVLPLARYETTVLAPFSSLDEAFAATVRVRNSRVRPAALEITRSSNQWWVATRIEGRESTVKLLASECHDLMLADTQTREAEESAAWWQAYVAEESLANLDGMTMVRIGVLPRQLGPLVNEALDRASSANLRVERIHISPGLGAAIVTLPVPEDEETIGQFHRWRDALMQLADSVTVLAAPPALKRGIDVWGESPQTLEVMRALKAEFDPKRVLNPGRFAGGI